MTVPLMLRLMCYTVLQLLRVPAGVAALFCPYSVQMLLFVRKSAVFRISWCILERLLKCENFPVCKEAQERQGCALGVRGGSRPAPLPVPVCPL